MLQELLVFVLDKCWLVEPISCTQLHLCLLTVPFLKEAKLPSVNSTAAKTLRHSEFKVLDAYQLFCLSLQQCPVAEVTCLYAELTHVTWQSAQVDSATLCQGDLSPQAFIPVCHGPCIAQGSCKSVNTMLTWSTGINERPGYKNSHLFSSGLGWLPRLSPRTPFQPQLPQTRHTDRRGKAKQTHHCGSLWNSVCGLSLKVVLHCNLQGLWQNIYDSWNPIIQTDSSVQCYYLFRLLKKNNTIL